MGKDKRGIGDLGSEAAIAPKLHKRPRRRRVASTYEVSIEGKGREGGRGGDRGCGLLFPQNLMGFPSGTAIHANPHGFHTDFPQKSPVSPSGFMEDGCFLPPCPSWVRKSFMDWKIHYGFVNPQIHSPPLRKTHPSKPDMYFPRKSPVFSQLPLDTVIAEHLTLTLARALTLALALTTDY